VALAVWQDPPALEDPCTAIGRWGRLWLALGPYWDRCDEAARLASTPRRCASAVGSEGCGFRSGRLTSRGTVSLTLLLALPDVSVWSRLCLFNRLDP
jgi:hypothetical protein